MINAFNNRTSHSPEGILYYPANKAGTGMGNSKTESDNFGLSEDMLEQYGVWIKVEPEIISESESGAIMSEKPASKPGDVELDEIPEEETLPSDLNEDFSFEDIEIPKEEELEDSFDSMADEEPIGNDAAHELLSDEIESFEDELSDESLPEIDETDTFGDAVAGEGVNEDIGLDEPIELATEEIDLESDLKDDELDAIAALDEETNDSIPGGDIEDMPDMELDDIPDMASEDEELEDIDDTSVLPEIETEESMSELEMEEIFENGDEDEIPEFSEEVSDEEIEVPLSSNQYAAGRFDDLEHIESEIGSAAPAEEAFSVKDNSSILSKIEKELLAIKTELADIKSELASVRAPRETASSDQSVPKTQESAGFFDEEEDETIALTGDELNNILATAEITEAPTDFSEALEVAAEEVIREAPVTRSQTKTKTTSPQENKEELRYESSPIEKIELEETPITGESDEGLSPVSTDEVLFETDSGETNEIEMPGESDMELEISDSEFGADANLQEVEEISFEDAPDTKGTSVSDDIPLEEEIDIGLEDEMKSDSATADQDNIEDILEKDLESTPEISSETNPEEDIDFEESGIIEMEEPFDSKSDEPEVVDGIDFDLPEEEDIVLEKAHSKPVADIEMPFVEGEIEEISFESSEPEKNVRESDSDLDLEEISEAEVFEEILPESQSSKIESIDEIPIEEVSFDDAISEPTRESEADDELESIESDIAEEVLDLEADNLEEIPLEESESEALSTSDSLEIEEILPEDDIGLGEVEDIGIPLAEETDDTVTLPKIEHDNQDQAASYGDSPVRRSPREKSEGKGADVALIPENLKEELKSVLSYLDQLLDTIPEEKLEEFTKSDYFTTYKKLFEELGLAS